MKKRNLIHQFLFLSIFGIFLVSNSYTQESSSAVPVTEREKQLNQMIDELKRQKELAELERDIAKAKRDASEANPKPTATPIKSDTIISGEEIEPDIIVFEEMNRAVSKIGISIKKRVPQGATIAVFDDDFVADWKFYSQTFPLFKVVMSDLTENYCQLIGKNEVRVNDSPIKGFAIPLGLANGANLIGQVADILSYLRTETKTTGKTVSVLESSLIAQLFNSLSDRGDLQLFYPRVFSPASPVFCSKQKTRKPCCQNPTDSSCLVEKTTFCSEIAQLYDELYEARRNAMAGGNGSKEFTKLDKDFENFNSLFVDKSNATKKSSLEKYLNAEQFSELRNRQNVYFLDIRSIKAVGAQRLRKNLFFLSDKVDYSGGIIVEYSLFDSETRIVDSGIVTSYDGYKKPKALKK